MKILLVQMDVSVENQDSNIDKFFSILDKNAKKADIIVFPELWNTGFRFDNIKQTAVSENSELLKKISAIAKENNCAIIAGSIIEEKENKYYNTSFGFDKLGNIAGKYSKIHLFKPMYENKFIESGNSVELIKINNIKCGLTICYDLRFPELYRRLVLKGAEIIFLCAQFPKPRQDHFDVLCKVRAIEDQCFFVAVNRVGKHKKTEFFGHSQVISPWGKVLNILTENEEIIEVDIDIEEVRRVRKRLSVLEDIKLIK